MGYNLASNLVIEFIDPMNIRNFDLNLLVVLDALLEERNVSRAALRLSLSQPAISNALNRLRLQLNDEVMVRTAQGMQPTALALSLEKPIRAALQNIDTSLNSSLNFEPQHSSASFTIAVTDYVELMLMPQMIAQLATTAPLVRVTTVDLGQELPLQAMERGEIDLAIGRFTEKSTRVSFRSWLQEDLVVVARKAHPVNFSTLSLEDFLQLRHVWVSGGQTKGMVDQWLEEQGVARHISYITPNYMMASHLVVGSDLVVVLPRRFAQKYQEFLPLQLMELPMALAPFELGFAWASLRDKDQSLQWLIGLLAAR